MQPFATFLFLKTFRSWYRFLSSSQYWSKEDIEQYQLQRLKKLFTHAATNVPYYSQLFKKNHLDPNTLQNLSDIQNYPVLIKDILRSNKDIFKAHNFPTNAFYPSTTGGTTGTPLPFYVEKARWLGKHFAFNTFYMKQAGYRSQDRVISFTGKRKKIHSHPLMRTIECSTFHMRPEDLKLYYDKIRAYHPKFLTTYPSALTIFTQYLMSTHKSISGFHAIFCHGETLSEKQRIMFEDFYDCPVYDQYGHHEQCVFATTCSKSSLYHIYPAYGYVEIMDSKGRLVTADNGQGEIVATSLHNNVFPFLRYKTEDLAVVSTKECDCGRHFPLLKKIIGRRQDFLITSQNQPIPLTGLYHIIAESSPHARECQIYQDTPGVLIISLVMDKTFTDKDLTMIKARFKQCFNDDFQLSFQIVDSIPRTDGGKYQYLIQKIPNSYSV